MKRNKWKLNIEGMCFAKCKSGNSNVCWAAASAGKNLGTMSVDAFIDLVKSAVAERGRYIVE